MDAVNKLRFKQIIAELPMLAKLDAARLEKVYRKKLPVSLDVDVQLEKNSVFRNAYSGRRCFIIANGPSLNNQDLSCLKDEIIFTANQASRIPQLKKIDSDFHFVSDCEFFHKAEEQQEYSIYDTIKKSYSRQKNTRFFFTVDAWPYAQQWLGDWEAERYFFLQAGSMYPGYRKEFDFTKRIFDFATVVDAMIAFAIYAGFHEIYLLGCDCTGILSWVNTHSDSSVESYAYQCDEKEKQMMRARLGLRTSSEMQLLKEAKIFRDYRILGEYCKSKNIKLVNCTFGGILDVLPKQSLDSVLSTPIQRMMEE